MHYKVNNGTRQTLADRQEEKILSKWDSNEIESQLVWYISKARAIIVKTYIYKGKNVSSFVKIVPNCGGPDIYSTFTVHGYAPQMVLGTWNSKLERPKLSSFEITIQLLQLNNVRVLWVERAVQIGTNSLSWRKEEMREKVI